MAFGLVSETLQFVATLVTVSLILKTCYTGNNLDLEYRVKQNWDHKNSLTNNSGSENGLTVSELKSSSFLSCSLFLIQKSTFVTRVDESLALSLLLMFSPSFSCF